LGRRAIAQGQRHRARKAGRPARAEPPPLAAPRPQRRRDLQKGADVVEFKSDVYA
jgi:hypothetical protein